MLIKRQIYSLLEKKLQENKVVLFYGPRKVGKTTLLTKNYTAMKLNGEIKNSKSRNYGNKPMTTRSLK